MFDGLIKMRDNLFEIDPFRLISEAENTGSLSGNIASIIGIYQEREAKINEKKTTEKMYELELELSSARETSRRLNRRGQKLEKENSDLSKRVARLEKDKKDAEEELKQAYRDLIDSKKQINTASELIIAGNEKIKKLSFSLGKWRVLARCLFSQRMQGVLVNGPAESDEINAFIRVGRKFEPRKIQTSTLVRCVEQKANYTLVDFTGTSGKKEFAWVPSTNVKLSKRFKNKRIDTKLVRSANIATKPKVIKPKITKKPDVTSVEKELKKK